MFGKCILIAVSLFDLLHLECEEKHSRHVTVIKITY